MDFSGAKSIADLDHGGRVGDGFHRAVLESIDDDEDGHKRLKFAVTAGRFKGAKQTEKLNNPFMLGDDAAQKAAARNALVVSRLGLVTPEMAGKKDALIEWDRAVGKEFVIKVETRPMKPKLDPETGTMTGGGSFTGLAYSGIFPLDHPDIPTAVRNELALPPARAKTQQHTATATATVGAATQPAKVDLDNLFGK